MATVGDLIVRLDEIAPPWMADDGDAIGLQVGDPSVKVKRVCVAVDASGPVIDIAVERKADLLITHHPLIYWPLRSLATGDTVPNHAAKLIRSGTALFVMHTNYDTAPGGVNDVLAQALGVVDTSTLTVRRRDRYYKVAVFVPAEAVGPVRDAMADAGAGRIGLYSHCSFRAPGTGSFRPLPEARPYVGQVGRLEEVEEYRLEMICTGTALDGVVHAMREKHPYEEVAHDVYELANEPVKLGFGRVGALPIEKSLGEFAEHVRNTLDVRFPKLAGNPETRVKTVALCSGGGSSLYRDAAKAGADVFVTGDTKHHEILDANALGLAVIDAGHFETEKPGMVALADKLENELSRLGLEIGYIEAGW